MDGKTIKHYFLKQVKSLLIVLPLNLLVGFIYCLISKKMSIVSYSDVLFIIGGVYVGIGGLCYVGADNIGTANKMLIYRDANPRKNDESSEVNFNMSILITGISTILISYAVGTFQ